MTGSQKKADMERIKSALAAGSWRRRKRQDSLRPALRGVPHPVQRRRGKIGPDLTGYERGNVEFWLTGVLAAEH